MLVALTYELIECARFPTHVLNSGSTCGDAAALKQWVWQLRWPSRAHQWQDSECAGSDAGTGIRSVLVLQRGPRKTYGREGRPEAEFHSTPEIVSIRRQNLTRLAHHIVRRLRTPHRQFHCRAGTTVPATWTTTDSASVPTRRKRFECSSEGLGARTRSILDRTRWVL